MKSNRRFDLNSLRPLGASSTAGEASGADRPFRKDKLKASCVSLTEQNDQTWQVIGEQIREQNFFPETGRRLLDDLIARVKSELEPSVEKEEVLKELEFRRDGFAILANALRRPPELHAVIDRLIANANPAELAQWRARLDEQTRSIAERKKELLRPPKTSR